ncbi:MAG: IreB family regulatory phosphoprotein [Bacillota bacterium]|nr:IreB family regulatory phosphoprotein [Bacillota bacterium]
MEPGERTARFKLERETYKAKDVLLQVYRALTEKGYNPVEQLVGYLLSGDPAYITTHLGARSLIVRVERDELLEELVRRFVAEHAQP